jgi:hypothetical protein
MVTVVYKIHYRIGFLGTSYSNDIAVKQWVFIILAESVCCDPAAAIAGYKNVFRIDLL